MIDILENLCRTCIGEQDSVEYSSSKLESNQTLYDIFSEAPQQSKGCIGKITIKELLRQTTPQLSIDIDDPLPKSVCKNCLEKLESIYHFQQKCLIVEERLKDVIGVNTAPCQISNEVDPLTNTKTYDDNISENHKIKIQINECFKVENIPAHSSFVTYSQEACNESLLDWTQRDEVKQANVLEISNILPTKGQKLVNENNKNKLYICNECHTTYKTLKSLKRHMYLHQTPRDCKRMLKKSECSLWDKLENNAVKYTAQDNLAKLNESTIKKEQTAINTEEDLTQDIGIDFNCIHTDVKEEVEQIQTLENVQVGVQTDSKLHAQSDDKPFECKECGSRVKTQKSLKRHKRIHLRQPGERPQRSKTKYECQYCTKAFCQSSSLNDHMRIHTGEKPFLCSQCGKAFKILSNMKQHLLRHGSDRPYECPNCPKKFPCLTDLASHAAVHNKAKTHVCDVCGAAFVKPYLLKKHKMYHTGEKNHKCEYCDMRFVFAEQCRRHMRTHTGEKPYNCKYCSRAFAQSNDLTKHLRVHLGDSIYKCDLCPQGFRLLGDMRMHFNTHKNENEDMRQKNVQALEGGERKLQLSIGLDSSH